MARVTGSVGRAVYSGASTYGGGAAADSDSAAEMRRSWRLSRVRDEARVYPKKSSTGFVVLSTGDERSWWVTAAEGAAGTWQSIGVRKIDILRKEDGDSELRTGDVKLWIWSWKGWIYSSFPTFQSTRQSRHKIVDVELFPIEPGSIQSQILYIQLFLGQARLLHMEGVGCQSLKGIGACDLCVSFFCTRARRGAPRPGTSAEDHIGKLWV
jgi:hypothetical protein